MPAYCRLCRPNEKNDAYVVCNNCGSFACEDHFRWFPLDKNAFCTECFPRQVQMAANMIADAAQILLADDRPESLAALAHSIEGDYELREIMRAARPRENLEQLRAAMLRLSRLLEQNE